MYDKPKEWTPEETQYLEDNYSNMSVHVIVKQLGRSRNSVIGKANRMGLTSTHNLTQTISVKDRIDPTPMKYQKRPDRRLFKLEELTSKQCHYPYGVDDKEFCGLERERGAYCEEHYKRCYK